MATKFTITGSSPQVAGTDQTITVTADDVLYIGDHAITFSGAGNGSLASPTTLSGATNVPFLQDKNTANVEFGFPCTLTFTLGVATTKMVLLKKESAVIACTDGSISATGADRLSVTVNAAAAAFFVWRNSTATTVAGATFQVLEINASDGWGNTDPAYNFPAGKNLTFSFVNAAPDGTLPTISNNAGVAKDFGLATAINFNLGQAVSDGTQLDAVFYLVGAGQEMRFTDGTLDSALTEGGGFLTPKIVNVTVGAIDHFLFVLGSGQREGFPFFGTNTLTATDTWDNIVTTFDASADPVTIAGDAPPVGVVTGLGSADNDTLDQAADFVNGVANLTGSMTFVGVGNGTFTATSVALITGTSNSITFDLNDFSSNPLILTSVMSFGYQDPSNGAPNNLSLYPQMLDWDAPTGAGDILEIQDDAGVILFNAVAIGANDSGGPFVIPEGTRWPAMWKLTTLQSGTLYIYFTT